jgi:hypothetical protein
LNLVTDMCIILIPIPIILPLKISYGRKFGLLLMFGAGVFVMIAAILRVYFVMVVSSSCLNPTFPTSLRYLQLEKGETAAIWSCREDVVAIIIGQATMVRPLFTRRFWSDDPTGSSSYSSNKKSDGYESHELSRGSLPAAKASRLGFRPVKDPYNISALRSHGNESQEDIIAGEQNIGFTKAPTMNTCEKREKGGCPGIVVETEVDVSTQHGKQEFQQNWKPV